MSDDNDDRPKIQIITPQFERPAHWPKPKGPPKTDKGWKLIQDCTVEQLKELGCVNWDGELFLFPGEWYEKIPESYPLVCINGKTEFFEKGKTDNDIRMGCLAYGVKAIDGKKKE